MHCIELIIIKIYIRRWHVKVTPWDDMMCVSSRTDPLFYCRVLVWNRSAKCNTIQDIYERFLSTAGGGTIFCHLVVAAHAKCNFAAAVVIKFDFSRTKHHRSVQGSRRSPN